MADQVIDGVTAPAGGFKQGGWYQGRQFWGGTLSAPGVINSLSDQQGAGKPVSSEVNRQSSVAQGKDPGAIDIYLQNLNRTSSGGGGSGGGSAQGTLDNFQSAATAALDNVSLDASKSDAQILAEVRDQLTPKTAQPTPPNLAQTEANLQVSSGLVATQGQLTTVNGQIAQIQAALEAQKAKEESQGADVPLGVVAGRQTEESRQAQIKLDSLNLQKGVLIDQINMQTSNINTIMQLTQQDYQNASQAWQAEFDVNAKIYDAFTTAVTRRDDLAFKIKQAAATNLQTMANLISAGNINYGSLSPDAKLQIAQMETQAGLPVGTLGNIQMSAKDRLLNVSNYRGQVTALTQDANGQIQVQQFGSQAPYAGVGGTGTANSDIRAAQDEINQYISDSGAQANISPEDAVTMLKDKYPLASSWLDKNVLNSDGYAIGIRSQTHQ
jgi:hypothetical protein